MTGLDASILLTHTEHIQASMGVVFVEFAIRNVNDCSSGFGSYTLERRWAP